METANAHADLHSIQENVRFSSLSCDSQSAKLLQSASDHAPNKYTKFNLQQIITRKTPLALLCLWCSCDLDISQLSHTNCYHHAKLDRFSCMVSEEKRKRTKKCWQFGYTVSQVTTHHFIGLQNCSDQGKKTFQKSSIKALERRNHINQNSWYVHLNTMQCWFHIETSTITSHTPVLQQNVSVESFWPLKWPLLTYATLQTLGMQWPVQQFMEGKDIHFNNIHLQVTHSTSKLWETHQQ